MQSGLGVGSHSRKQPAG